MNKREMEIHFSTWFDIIPLYPDAKMLWEDGDRNFLILTSDGADRYASCYEDFEQIVREVVEGALIGLERVKKKVEVNVKSKE